MSFFSINKNQAAVLVTLIILIFLGCGYFFIYIPQNERRIVEQRFSALQNIDRNIHAKIENSIGLLNNSITAYLHANDSVKNNLTAYIKNYSTTNFTLTKPDTFTIRKNVVNKNSTEVDSVYHIKVDNITREINLTFSKLKIAENIKDSNVVYKMGMKFTFKQFIQFLLPKDVFDDYIIFSKGRPVYESFPSGISYVKEDTLLSLKNGIGSSGVRDQVISGIDYKLFLQPVGFDSNNEWVIGGLLTNKHYQNERNQLPTQIVLILATALLICMVAFPWLKLYQMGNKDRLTISDAIASIFISMILVSLIFFVFFNYNHFFRPLENNNSKITLANGIYTSFKNELDKVYAKLTQYDMQVNLKEKDIINLNKNTIKYTDKRMPAIATAINETANGININQVFWLNKYGQEIVNWTTDTINAPHGDFKNRGYFKRINESRPYYLDGNKDKAFFLEQVISFTSGSFRSVMSKRSFQDSTNVAALSFNFNCLDKVILPTGFLFAITDNVGNVLYHSDASRNLNENVISVFSNNSELKSCFQARVAGTFYTKYYGNNYTIQVKPVAGLPYFILVFEDEVYNETREMEIYSFTFLMLFLFFGMMILQLFAIFLVSAKRSFFKKQFLDTSWIGPKISCNNEYILSAIFNLGITVLLIIFFNRVPFLLYFFMVLFSVTYIPLFLNTILAKRYSDEKINLIQFKKSAKYCLCFFIIMIALAAFKLLVFTNFIYLILYQILLVVLGQFIYLKRRLVYKLAILLMQSTKFKFAFAQWNYVNNFSLMALSRLIITSGIPVVFFYISAYNYEQNLSVRYKQIDFANRVINKFESKTADKIINRNAAVNGVFYDGSLINSMNFINIANALMEKDSIPYSYEESRTIDVLKSFRLYATDKAILQDEFYGKSAADTSFFFNHLLNEACASDAGTTAYRQLNLPAGYLKIQSEDFNYPYPTVFKKDYFNGGLFWLLLVICIGLFYFIINNIVNKLFSLHLPDLEVWKNLDYKILTSKNLDQPLFVIGLPGAGKKKYLLEKIKNLELVAEDGSPYIYKTIPDETTNVFIAELVNIPSLNSDQNEMEAWEKHTKEVFDKKNKMIIINHFEYNIQDPVSTRFKLQFLEQLFLDFKCKIVILSTIHPVAFLDSAMDPSIKMKQDEKLKGDEKSLPGQDLEKWHVLLGHYRIVVLPLQLRSASMIVSRLHGIVHNKNSGYGIRDVSIKIKDARVEVFSTQGGIFILPDHSMPFTAHISLEGYHTKEVVIRTATDLLKIDLEQSPSYLSAQLIRQETAPTYFLSKMQEPMFQAGKLLTEEMRILKMDELAFKLQVSSHYFYMYIWQSLTKEEKFLLYDLAEDNLVNSFDDYNLSMLIAKGVIIKQDGTLKLFNKGFRNFILTAIGNSEAMKIKNQMQDNGNWNTLKNPLLLVIVAILAFLLTSQEAAFAKLLTYVAALGAGIPTILKLFSLFDKTPAKTN